MSSFNIRDLFNVDGLVAVITGGGSGLGKVMTQALATNGASKIYILGRRKDRLEAAAREINPDVVVPIVADVASKESLVQAADTIRAEMGYVNILIANAGIVFSSPSPASSGSGLSGGGPIQIGRALKNNPTPAELESYLIETPEAEFRDTYMINSAGVFYSIAAFVSLLHAGNEKKTVSQKSQVVAVASVAGQHRYATGGCAYGMSKAAVITLMKQMMTYLVPLNIRANTISPGVFPTEIAGPISEKDLTEEGAFSDTYIPLGRGGKEYEMAGTILYLASKAGSYVNGDLLVVDGGRLGYL